MDEARATGPTPTTASRRSGWPWFAAWAAAGAVFVVGLVGSFGVLAFLLPIGGAALVVLALRARVWPEALGIGTGVAGLLLFVAYANLNYAPCPIEPTTVTRLPGYRPPACGGIDPMPWLVIGIALLAITLISYSALRRRQIAPPLA